MSDAQRAYEAREFGSVAPGGGAIPRERIDALLREAKVVALATTDDDGYPYQVPIWVDWDGREAWLVTRAKAAFMGHIQARPRVSLLRLEGLEGAAANTRIQVVGDAEIVAGPGPLAPGERMFEVALRLATRYQGAEIAARYIERTREWPRCLVRIRPIRIVSWDHHDWHPRYRGDQG